jgi:hypothetical protein
MARRYKHYAITLDQETRGLLDQLTERLALPSRSAILRLAVRELAERHGLKTRPLPASTEEELNHGVH